MQMTRSTTESIITASRWIIDNPFWELLLHAARQTGLRTNLLASCRSPPTADQHHNRANHTDQNSRRTNQNREKKGHDAEALQQNLKHTHTSCLAGDTLEHIVQNTEYDDAENRRAKKEGVLLCATPRMNEDKDKRSHRAKGKGNPRRVVADPNDKGSYA